MDMPSFLDEEVIFNPMYWLLTGGAILALLIGFKSQTLWSNGSMPLSTMIITICGVPIASYFIVWKFKS